MLLGELRHRRVPGFGVLDALVKLRDPTEPIHPTELETLVRRFLRRFKLPPPEFQWWVTLPDYGRARLDFAWPGRLIGVEAQSFRWHAGHHGFEREQLRMSEFAAAGWLILRVTSDQVRRRPELVAARIRRAFDARSSVA
jgi:very-short-patch-repair endonuclease